MGYLLEHYCYPTYAAFQYGAAAKAGEVVGGGRVIVNVNTVDDGGGNARIELVFSDSTSTLVYVQPCPNWGPVPDPFYMPVPIAAALVVSALTTWAAAWIWKSVRGIR